MSHNMFSFSLSVFVSSLFLLFHGPFSLSLLCNVVIDVLLFLSRCALHVAPWWTTCRWRILIRRSPPPPRLHPPDPLGPQLPPNTAWAPRPLIA